VSTHSRQVVERVIEELCYSPESTPGNSALISNSVGVIKGIYPALDERAMVSADSRAVVPLHSAHAHDRRP
jgi:hypothetical protein